MSFRKSCSILFFSVCISLLMVSCRSNDVSYFQDMTNESGIHADETTYDGDDQRFLHHRWFNGDGVSMYELFLAKRCPHALDIRTTTYAWQFLKRFSRNSDGSLSVSG